MSPIKNLAKISLSQKKIFLVSAGIFCLFSVVWVFLYIPTKAKVRRLRSDLDSVHAQIRQVEGMIEDKEKMGEGIRLLEEENRRLSSKFPSREEEALTKLFDLAHQIGIEITSIKSQPRQLCGQTLTVEGKKCHELSVSLNITGSYKGLVEYLELLRDALPAFVTFERLMINKGGAGAAMLNISLDLKLYLLA